MIDPEAIRGTIATYMKHGWILRRVLLSAESHAARELLENDDFGHVPIHDSEIDAVWISRPPRPGGVAWELRYLGNTPFALVEHADENAAEFEQTLADVEQRLRAAVHQKKGLTSVPPDSKLNKLK